MGIFEQIKNAFSSGERGPARKEVKPQPAPSRQPEVSPEAPGSRSYTVRSGDTLWKIADDLLGDGARYTEIFEANRTVLDSPDHILPGQVLKIP